MNAVNLGGFGQQIGEAGFNQFKPTNVSKKPDPIFCDTCGVQCTSQETYTLHVNGKKHASKLQQLNKLTESNATPSVEPSKYECTLCNIKCMNQDMLDAHHNGAKHQKAKQKQDLKALQELKDPSVYCSVCDIFLDPNLMETHLEGAKHQRNVKSPRQPNQDGPPTKKVKHDPVSEFNLSISHCGACNAELTSESVAIIHYQSKNHGKHLHLAAMRKSPYPCEPCKKAHFTLEAFERHCEGFRHQWKVSRSSLDPNGKFAKKIELEKKRMLKFQENLKQL